MLAKADTSIKDIIKIFSEHGMSISFLVPTETGMKKSIMDATAPVRDFLKENEFHDYSAQQQGPDNKVLHPIEIILSNQTIQSQVSLYRPLSKLGDPRIYIYGLAKYAKPYNLLALFIHNNKLYVINASHKEIIDSINNADSPLGKLAIQARNSISDVASELLTLLRDVTGDKFIPTICSGDTGVGATLEHLLGIKRNNKKTPDYKGIEIKSSRHDPARIKAKNRVNLFSQVPDWQKSSKSAMDVLKEYGYTIDGRLQLYCTLDALHPNSQKLMLAVAENEDSLKAISRIAGADNDLLIWAISKLKARMAEKHPESFWIKAEAQIIAGVEHFRYYKAIHTSSPMISNMDYLLNDGTISLDLTMSQKSPRAVNDHGYLFKIWPEDFVSIFPPPKQHSLIDW